MGRAGKRTIQQVRRHRLGVLRRNWRLYVVVLLGYVVLGAALLPWQSPAGGGFLVGVLATTYVALVAHSLTLDGSHFRMMGAEAERWTSAALRKADGWRVLDRVEFADRDVDHVAVGPAHVLAVETKWTSRPVRITQQGVGGLWCDGVHHAGRAAERTRWLLASKGVDHPVLPVLVLWGPGVPEIPGGYQRIGEVRVLVGAQADQWRSRLDDLPRWSSSTREVLPALDGYVARFDRHQETGWRARLRGSLART